MPLLMRSTSFQHRRLENHLVQQAIKLSGCLQPSTLQGGTLIIMVTLEVPNSPPQNARFGTQWKYIIRPE